MLLSRAVPLVWLLAATSMVPAAAQSVATAGQTAMTSPVSPSVVATYIGERIEPGMERLRLLVLWRDQPGWFAGSGVVSSSAGGGGTLTGGYRTQWRLGNVQLEAEVDTRTETAVVLGQRFDLRHSNVILIDGALAQGTVVGTLGVQAQVLTIPGTISLERIGSIFTLPDIRQFLRCDQPASVPVPRVVSLCGPARPALERRTV
jgi:hypothetical protein